MNPRHVCAVTALIVMMTAFTIFSDHSSPSFAAPDGAAVSELRNHSGERAVDEEKRFSEPEIKGTSEASISLFSWFKRGGLFMWPLLILAAAGMGFIIERFIFFKKADLNPREFLEELDTAIREGGIEEVEALCKNRNLIISRIILKGLNLRSLGFDHVEKGISAAGSIEVMSLEKGLTILSSIGNIAPLLGFLGTVSGMIAAFQSIAAVDQVSARLVAGGIFEALITTETGLIIAIPVLIFYNYFVHRIEAFISDIERLASDIIEKLVRESA
ncbi:MAG TPA: MotA/TolQ/ExbB proton channel family protein [Spirochaetes bacterium]|nr:MotA/TolQ/ExbB proton channel family protein [Spirochaetota bacterium]